MFRKIFMACGLGIVLSSSILAAAQTETAGVYFSLAAGVYTTPHVLVLSDSQSGAVIYYTTKPGTPVSTWTTYNPASPIVINATETIYAIAQAPGYSLSSESAKAYTYNPAARAAAPYFSLGGGIYTTPQTLTLTSTTPGASFCYTTTGKSPVDSNGMLDAGCIPYTGPITISQTELVEAVTIASGYNLSAVSNKEYIFPGVGNSLLGVVEGAMSFCGQTSAGSPAGYTQMDQLLTNGQNAQVLSQARSSSDYAASYSQVTSMLKGLPASQALTQCTTH